MAGALDGLFSNWLAGRKAKNDENYRVSNQNLQATLEGIPYDMKSTKGDGGYANGLEVNPEWYDADRKLNDRKNPGSSGIAKQSLVAKALAGTPSLPGALPGDSVGAAPIQASGTEPAPPPHVQARIAAMQAEAAKQGKVPTYQEMMAATGAGDSGYQAPPRILHDDEDDGGLLAQHLKEAGTTRSVGHTDPSVLNVPQGPAPLMENPEEKKMNHEKAMAVAQAGTQAQAADKEAEREDARRAADSAQEMMGPPVQKDGKLYAPANQKVGFDTAKVRLDTGSSGSGPDLGASGPAEGAAMPYPAAPPPPPAPEAPEEDIRPSPFMMKRITEQNTAAPHSRGDRMVQFNTLPPEWQKIMGVEGVEGSAPESLIKEVISKRLAGENKTSAAAASPEAITLGDAIVARQLTVPGALASLARQPGGIKVADQKFLMGLGGQAATQGRADDALSNRKENQAFMRENRDRDDQRAEENKLNDQANKYTTSLDKSGIPTAIEPLRIIQKYTGIFGGGKENLNALPGYGTNLSRKIPFVGAEIGAAISGQAGPHNKEVLAAMQSLINTDYKTYAGTNVSGAEEARQQLAQGLAGASEKDVRDGLKKLYAGLINHERNIMSGVPKSAIDRVRGERQGLGSLQDEVMGKPGSEEKQGASAPEANGYDAELKSAQQRLAQYREQVQGAIGAGKEGAKEAAPKIRAKMAQLDSYFQSKYGKGFKDAQTQ